MKTIILLPAVILGLLTVACGPAPAPPGDDHQDAATATIQLNNGQKWVANPETTAGIANMTRLLENFDPGSADATAYQALGQQLQTEFGEIFRQCTMTGEAHEQLHRFLLPMVELLETLKSGEGASLPDVYQQLRDHLFSYSTYFQ